MRGKRKRKIGNAPIIVTLNAILGEKLQLVTLPSYPVET